MRYEYRRDLRAPWTIEIVPGGYKVVSIDHQTVCELERSTNADPGIVDVDRFRVALLRAAPEMYREAAGVAESLTRLAAAIRERAPDGAAALDYLAGRLQSHGLHAEIGGGS